MAYGLDAGFMRLYTYQLASLVKIDVICEIVFFGVLQRISRPDSWYFQIFLGEDIPHLDGSRKSLVEAWCPVQTNNYWLVVWNMAFMTFHILGIMIPTDFHIFQRVGIPPTRLYRWHQSIHSLVVARVTFETQLFRHDLRYVVTGIVVQHKLHLVPVKTCCACCSFVNLGSLDTLENHDESCQFWTWNAPFRSTNLVIFWGRSIRTG